MIRTKEDIVRRVERTSAGRVETNAPTRSSSLPGLLLLAIARARLRLCWHALGWTRKDPLSISLCLTIDDASARVHLIDCAYYLILTSFLFDHEGIDHVLLLLL